MTGRHPREPTRSLPWLAPAVTAVAAVTADLLPLTAGPGPLFTFCLVYAWALRAPKRLPAPAVFLLGLVLDGVAGTPLGFSSLTLLLVHGGAVAARRALDGAPFAAAWAGFAAAVLAGCGARWLLASFWWWHAFAVRPSLIEAVLTFAAYPLVGWPVAHLQSPSRAGRHAAGG